MSNEKSSMIEKIEMKNFNTVVYIGTTEAKELIKDRFPLNSLPTLPTIITWIKKYNLGFKFGGRWKINKELFMEFLCCGDCPIE